MLNTKHYYIKILYHSIVRGQTCTAESNLQAFPLTICFIKVYPDRKRIISSLLPLEGDQKEYHGTDLIYQKVNVYYLFLNQELSNSAVIRKNQIPNNKSYNLKRSN